MMQTTEFATSGMMPRDVSRGVTAAGTVQDSHLIPFSSLTHTGREPQHVQFVTAKIQLNLYTTRTKQIFCHNNEKRKSEKEDNKYNKYKGTRSP